MWVTLQLILQGTKIGSGVLRLPFDWQSVTENRGLQSAFIPTLQQWPTHSCCLRGLQVVMDGALADRTSPGDLPLPHLEFEV
jgi:hypothetical protein